MIDTTAKMAEDLRASAKGIREDGFYDEAILMEGAADFINGETVDAKAMPADLWLPIETAPKDGTRVILFVPGERIFVGEYYHRQIYELGTLTSDRSGWSSAGWLEFRPAVPFPTHWMPLPEEPK